MNRKAVFLDKDGTLVEDVPYNIDPSLIRLAPGAVEGLARMHQAGYLLMVVSNQSGVARGYFPESALGAVVQRLQELFDECDVPLAGFYYCPHHPHGSVAQFATRCGCRKPAPGMLLRAAQQHQIDLNRSWLVGDILDDIEAGRRAGCRTVLLRNSGETEWRFDTERTPDFLVDDLAEAARCICQPCPPRREKALA
jgi:D-glycero-D-manno-heptose 1,7-bisphosphate phosphatase